MPDIACVPPIDACGIENPDQPGHYCGRFSFHRSHWCTDGYTWPRDVEFELACALYLEHWTVRYTEAPEIPSRGVVEAACQPADSSWRKLARVAQRMLGVAA